MAKVSSSQHLGVPPEKVWETIGQFNGLPDWHPAIQKSELEKGGNVRRLTLAGGGTIVERLERIDNETFKYSYSIVDSPLPVSDYVSEIRVVKDDSGNGCKVEWSSEFEPCGGSASDAEKAIRDVYEAGLNNLKAMYGG